MRRHRSKSTTVRINNRLVTVVTIAGLSEIIGKSKDTILRYERQEIFPQAPFKFGNVRYYPVSLATALKRVVQEIINGKPINPDVVVKINQLFKEERSKYAE